HNLPRCSLSLTRPAIILSSNVSIWWVMALFIQTCALVFAQGDEVQAIVHGNARFAFALYREVVQSDSGNVLISPWSATCGLLAPRIGAEGETASEISKATCLELSSDALLRGFGVVNERVQQVNDPSGVTLLRATGIWCHPEQPLLQDFVQACKLVLD